MKASLVDRQHQGLIHTEPPASLLDASRVATLGGPSVHICLNAPGWIILYAPGAHRSFLEDWCFTSTSHHLWPHAPLSPLRGCCLVLWQPDVGLSQEETL